MPYLYLVMSVIFSSVSTIIGTQYNRKSNGKKAATALYNFLLMCAVCVGWFVLFGLDFSFDAAVLPFSLLFAFFYATCNIALINALKCGPVSLSSLLLNLSLIVTTIWGILFWDAKFNLLVIIGLVLVVLSLFLCIYTKEKASISKKWLFFIFLALICNAGCAITQRTQQKAFNEQHGNMLMAFASLISLVICFILYMRSDRSDSGFLIKKTGAFPIIAGLSNVGLNLLVILLASSDISTNLIYPVIGVGGLAITLLFSQLVFKEKLRPAQWIGILAGATATVLLSI